MYVSVRELRLHVYWELGWVRLFKKKNDFIAVLNKYDRGLDTLKSTSNKLKLGTKPSKYHDSGQWQPMKTVMMTSAHLSTFENLYYIKVNYISFVHIFDNKNLFFRIFSFCAFVFVLSSVVLE